MHPDGGLVGESHRVSVAPEVLVELDLRRVGAGRHVVTARRHAFELRGGVVPRIVVCHLVHLTCADQAAKPLAWRKAERARATRAGRSEACSISNAWGSPSGP